LRLFVAKIHTARRIFDQLARLFVQNLWAVEVQAERCVRRYHYHFVPEALLAVVIAAVDAASGYAELMPFNRYLRAIGFKRDWLVGGLSYCASGGGAVVRLFHHLNAPIIYD
jgi:hypothetical protein